MSRDRASVVASPAPPGTTARRPRQSLKSVAPAEKNEKSKKAAALANTAVTQKHHTPSTEPRRRGHSTAHHVAKAGEESRKGSGGLASTTLTHGPTPATASAIAVTTTPPPSTTTTTTPNAPSLPSASAATTTSRVAAAAANSAASSSGLRKQRANQLRTPLTGVTPSPSTIVAARMPDRRSRTVSLSKKRTSKELGEDKTRTAGIKLPPLLPGTSEHRAVSQPSPTALKMPECVNRTPTLSPIHDASFSRSTTPSYLQHSTTETHHGGPNHSGSLAPISNSSNGTSTASPRTPPALSDKTTTAAAFPKASLSASAPSGVGSCSSSHNTSTTGHNPSYQRFSPSASATSNVASSFPFNKSGGAPRGSSIAKPTSSRSGSPSQSLSLDPPKTTTAAVAATAVAVARGATPHVAAEPSSPDLGTSNASSEVDDMPDKNSATRRMDGDMLAALEDASLSTSAAAVRGAPTSQSLKAGRNEEEEDDDDKDGVEDEDATGCLVAGDQEEEEEEEEEEDEEEEDEEDEEDEDDDDDETSDEDYDEDEEGDSNSEDTEDESEASSSSDDSSDEEDSEVAPVRRGKKPAPKARVAVGAGVAAAGAIRSNTNSARGKVGKAPKGSKKKAATSGSTSTNKKKGKDKVAAAPRRIRTKISREGDINVKVVYAVRTRRCFNKFVKEIMTRFGFAKATDFDMYCIDATGDRVDIDVEEDFDQLLDAFEETMDAAAAAEAEEEEAARAALSHGLHSKAGHGATSAAAKNKGRGSNAGSGPLCGKPFMNSGAAAAGNSNKSFHGSLSGSANSNVSPPPPPPSKPRVSSPSPSSGFGATTMTVMEDDGKSSSSVLRLYVRYSNAYYLEHGYPEHPRTPSPSSSLYASPNPPGRINGPNVASLFTTQLQQLSTLPSTPSDGRRSADPYGNTINTNNGGFVNSGGGGGGGHDGSPLSHTLLASTMGSVSGANGFGAHPGSRGASGAASHFLNTTNVTNNGAGNTVRSTCFTGPNADLLSPENASLAMLTETQRSVFANTFSVGEDELVEWRRMSVLGKGSFGTVYEGITMDGKMIAVKVQELPQDDDAAEIKALQTEINLMRSLKHRNIVAYYGCQTRVTATGSQQMEIFLELCHGGSLATLRRKLIKTQQTFGISLVRSYTRQVLEGLAYLHAQHVIHRDIKCDNVLISATGEAKLADFGCSKRFGGGTAQAAPETLPPSAATKAQASATAAMYQTMVGSPFFMAPEVMREDEGGYTSAADIWSVGCLVIELLGREPWDITGTNIFQIMFRIAREQGMPTGVPANCPPMLRGFFERCFNRDPAKRATAEELLEHEWMTCPDKLLEEVPEVTDTKGEA